MRRSTRIVLLGMLVPALLAARNRNISQIDDYCNHLDSELADSTPFLFEGPDPWAEIEESEIDDSDPPPAFASVYTVGPQIRRVFLRITDEEGSWREDITYFYSPGGELVKRVRTLESPGANILLETIAYYRSGELLKQSSHHHALVHGKQDSSRFMDPGAPVFWTTDDLPFSDLVDIWRGLT